MPFGIHVNKNGRTLSKAIEEEVAIAAKYNIEMTAAQIFVMGPRSFTATIDAAEITHVAATIKRLNVSLVVHANYFDHPWEADARCIRFMNEELAICDKIGASGFVVHLPKRPPIEIVAGLCRVDVTDAGADSTNATPIFLEIESARADKYTYETGEKIMALFAEIDKAHAAGRLKRTIGLCIDTAHLHSAGVKIRTADEAKLWLAGIKDLLSPTSIHPIMIHLNDQEHEFHSGKDKHAVVTKGKLWGGYGADGIPINQSGFQAFYDMRADHIVIMERHDEKGNDDYNVLACVG
jgi:endonuclease IV